MGRTKQTVSFRSRNEQNVRRAPSSSSSAVAPSGSVKRRHEAHPPPASGPRPWIVRRESLSRVVPSSLPEAPSLPPPVVLQNIKPVYRQSSKATCSPWSEQRLLLPSPSVLMPESGVISPNSLSASLFPRSGYSLSATSSQHEKLLLFGGLGNKVVRNDLYSLDVHDLSVSLLATTGFTPSPRFGHASVLVNNALIVWGGDTSDSSESPNLDDGLYLLKLATLHWTRFSLNGPAPAGRYGHALAMIGTCLYVFGGNISEEYFNDLWTLDLDTPPNEAAWELIIPSNNESPQKRTGHAFATCGDRIIIIGGRDDTFVYDDTWAYDTKTRQWTELSCSGHIISPRVEHAAAIVDDIIYVFGGRGADGRYLGELAAFTISNERWYKSQQIDLAPSARSGHRIASIGKKIFVLGGESFVLGHSNVSSTIHILDTEQIDYYKLGNENILSSPAGTLSNSSRAFVEVGNFSIASGEGKADHLPEAENITTAHHQFDSLSILHADYSASDHQMSKRDPAERLRRLLVYLRDLNLSLRVRVLPVRQSCGGCADIYIGEIVTDNGRRLRIAVKRARFSVTGDMLTFTKKVVREMRIWSLLFHENILPLMGFIEEDGTSCPSMITEWMENGSLKQFLQANDNVNILFMVTGIAEGLSYLHSNDVVHGDLKAENVVISPAGIPLIMDFGISHLLISATTVDTATAANKGSLRWQALELLDESPSDGLDAAYHTKESDIWAFGMTCLEVLTRELPYARCRSDFQVVSKLIQKMLPEEPPDFAEWLPVKKALWGICGMCWQWERNERPDIDELLLHIQSLSTSN